MNIVSRKINVDEKQSAFFLIFISHAIWF